MGKMVVEVTYKAEKINLDVPSSASSQMYMQRETFVNRKVPLNGYLDLFIGGIKNLKEGINNI